MAKLVPLRRDVCGERPAAVASAENAADETGVFALFPSSKGEIMSTSRKPSFAMLVALGLTAAVVAALAGVTARLAMAQTPAAPPLTTEYLVAASGLSGQAGTIDIQGDCRPATGRPTIHYTATGPATGPYPGTYRESGIATLERITPINLGVPLVAFSARFTIDSPVGRVTGTKQLDPTMYHWGICNIDTRGGFPVGIYDFAVYGAPYTAVVTTATGTCTTRGSAYVGVVAQDAPGHPNVDAHRLDEYFNTGTSPVCVAGPTSKGQCKKGGWRRFTDPSFKNQGQCIKFVNQRSKAGKQKGDDEKSKGKKSGKGNGGKKK